MSTNPVTLDLPANLPPAVRAKIEADFANSVKQAELKAEKEAAKDSEDATKAAEKLAKESPAKPTAVAPAPVSAAAIAPVAHTLVAAAGVTSVVSVVPATATGESFFTKLGEGIKDGVEDVLKIAEDAVSIGEKTVKAIEEIRELTPEFKSDLTIVINDCKAIAAAVAPAIAADGANPITDATAVVAAMPAVIQLVKDFVSFVPQIATALSAIEASGSAPVTAPAVVESTPA